MKNRVLQTIAATGAAAALTFSAMPAQAVTLDWPNDGVFTVGDAAWAFDNYGLSYPKDAADVYQSNGFIYYPMEFFATSDDPSVFDNYLYCGYDNNQAESVVTQEDNGDISISCPEFEVGENTDVFAQLTFRIYAESATGYLIREEAIIRNDSLTEVSYDPIGSYQYVDGYVFDSVGTSLFTSSTGDTDPAALDEYADWFISTYENGNSLVQTTAWSKTGTAESEGIATQPITTGDYLTNDYGTRVIAAGEALHFVQFTNMVIPAAQTEDAAAAAYAIAQEQVTEFDTFSGRLVAGLDPNVNYIGWGAPAADPTPTPDAELASTGSGASGSLLGIAITTVIAGTVALAAVRRRA